MARLIGRLVRAMLALGTPWGLLIALPQPCGQFASPPIDERRKAIDDFYRAINVHLFAAYFPEG